jgi:hypothetical protein
MPPVHRFAAHQRELRDKWFEIVETEDTWTVEGPIGEGESQSIRVRCDQDGMRGAAKPGPGLASQEDHCRAAHEKLAFDLSYLAALPISPVVLWRLDAPDVYKRGRSISCWAFPQGQKWSQANVSGLISPISKNTAGPTISAMRVFHTWIGDNDRKQDHVFVDLDSPPNGELRIAFFDHGNSMSNTWKAENAASPVCPNYTQDVSEDRNAMIEAADHIGGIPDAYIQRLVDRIPGLYLPDSHRRHIIQNLLARKGNLRALMGL